MKKSDSNRSPAQRSPVLILGAGINGVSLARELVCNGVSCWVVDQGDIACGATSKSSRLIHGGLRYLEYAEFRLVREALIERDRLLRLAPQFVKPLTFAIPIRQRSGGWWAALRRLLGLPAVGRTSRGLWLTRMGLSVYDWFSRRSNLPSHRVSRRGDEDRPRVAEGFPWICRYADAQMQFPERYTVTLLRDAADMAAEQGLDFRVLTHQQVLREGAQVQLTDLHERLTIQPPLLVNATGAWGDTTLAQLAISTRRLFGGTKGSHLLVSSATLSDALGKEAVYAETSDGRFVFVLPFGQHVLVGTTDEPFSDDPLRAQATEQELDYLFKLVADVFPTVTLSQEDVLAYYSGVRPLPFSEGAAPGAISRDHHVELTEAEIPVLTLIGGKLTTSRQLGEQVADMIFKRLEISRVGSTRDRPVPGAGDALIPNSQPVVSPNGDSAASRFSTATLECLQALAGNALDDILAGLVSEDRRLIAGTVIPRGIARWVLRNEWVGCLEDLVERRLMLVLTGQLTIETLDELAELMIEERMIDADAKAEVVERCRQLVTQRYGYRW